MKTGKSIKYVRFVFKLKQIEFDLGSNRFLLLHDEYKANTPSRIKVYNFKTFLNFQVNPDDEKAHEKIAQLTDFPIVLPD